LGVPQQTVFIRRVVSRHASGPFSDGGDQAIPVGGRFLDCGLRPAQTNAVGVVPALLPARHNRRDGNWCKRRGRSPGAEGIRRQQKNAGGADCSENQQNGQAAKNGHANPILTRDTPVYRLRHGYLHAELRTQHWPLVREAAHLVRIGYPLVQCLIEAVSVSTLLQFR
jgi:hypothetical protein